MSTAAKAIRNWRRRVARQLRGSEAERGASAIEYAGILIIVAGIILAIRGLGLASAISGAVSNAVNNVLGG